MFCVKSVAELLLLLGKDKGCKFGVGTSKSLPLERALVYEGGTILREGSVITF